MVADLLFRVACHGGGDEPLNVHLKRITDSAYTRKTLGGVAIEGELVAPVIAESHDEECRREIMHYLRECLSEASGKRWQRIYGGLALTENLMQHGSPALLTEVAVGHHFDLVQKVSLLENFDASARGCTDRRAQNVVREKACQLNTMLVALLEKERAEEPAKLDIKDATSTCSSGSLSTATPSTAASSTRSSPTTSGSTPHTPRSPKKNIHIDDAFAALREWMDESDESRIGSAVSSPLSSAGESELSIDDIDWEPLEPSALSYSTTAVIEAKPDRQRCSLTNTPNGNDEEFFTPMPAPAFADPRARTASWLSL